MSKGNIAVKAESVPVKAAKPVAKEAEFPVEVLRKDSVKLFGVTTSTFDGAMDGHAGPYTVAQAKEIIEGWKRGVVK